jgi:hypothetical protein
VKDIMAGESHNQRLERWRQLQFPLKEALSQRDWVQSPGRFCAQSGTLIMSGLPDHKHFFFV